MNASPPNDQRPRSGGLLPIIAVILAALALLVAIGGVAALFLLRRAPKAAVAATSASTATPKITSPPPSASAQVDEPPIDESAPAGTPGASLRARPAWAKREVLTPHAQRVSQYAPQLTNPLELFLTAQPLGANVDRGVVICRFQTFNKHDMFAGDDLHARVKLGATPEAANDGPEDGNLAFVSAPLVQMKTGDHIAFQVFDRDVLGLTPITTTGTTFAGAPVTMMDSGAAIECKAITGDALGRASSAKLSAASLAVIELERDKLRERAPEWGYPAAHVAAAEKALSDAAALTGWDDHRTHERVAKYDAQVDRLRAEREAIFDRYHASTSTTARTPTFEVSLANATCDGRLDCITLTVTNRSTTPAAFGAYPMSIYFATRTGMLWASSLSSGGDKVQPGATVNRTVVAMRPLPQEPLLLGLCTNNDCTVLTIR